MIETTREPINLHGLLDRLDKTGAGSLVFHLGMVKPDPEGKRSSGITFSDLGGLEAELKGIEAELRSSFKLTDVIVVRRLGELGVGDFILAVLVAAKDRENAFGACRRAVERLKTMKNLKKVEHYL